MALKMSFNKEQLKGQQPIPGNQIYEVQLVDFKLKFNKAKDGYTFNPHIEVVNNSVQEYNKRRVFDNMVGNKTPWIIQDLVHCFGLEMEGGTDMPGSFEGDPNNPETCKYVGPLKGRRGKIMVAINSYNGKDSNVVKAYICAVTNCATRFPEIKHSTSLVK